MGVHKMRKRPVVDEDERDRGAADDVPLVLLRSPRHRRRGGRRLRLRGDQVPGEPRAAPPRDGVMARTERTAAKSAKKKPAPEERRQRRARRARAPKGARLDGEQLEAALPGDAAHSHARRAHDHAAAAGARGLLRRLHRPGGGHLARAPTRSRPTDWIFPGAARGRRDADARLSARALPGPGVRQLGRRDQGPADALAPGGARR